MVASTKDSIIWDDLIVHQPRQGYRFSMDSVILARLVKARPSNSLLEIGSGCGVCLLILARSNSIKQLTGVEIQKSIFDISLKNVQKNGLTDRIKLFNHDIKTFANEFTSKFDIIISNPPFYRINSGRLSKNNAETSAKHEKYLDLKSLLISTKKLLKSKGCLYLLYNSDRVAELLHEMRNLQIEPKLILPIYPCKNDRSNLIWVKGINNAKPGLKLLKPLFYYSAKNLKSNNLKAFYGKSSLKLKKIYPEIF